MIDNCTGTLCVSRLSSPKAGSNQCGLPCSLTTSLKISRFGEVEPLLVCLAGSSVKVPVSIYCVESLRQISEIALPWTAVFAGSGIVAVLIP